MADATLQGTLSGDYMKKVGHKMAEDAGGAKTISFVDFSGDPVVDRKPLYYVYVFNIAHRRFEVFRPPQHPRVVFKGCPKTEPYALVARLPDLVQWKDVIVETGEMRVVTIRGERFAIDLLNPLNYSTKHEDQWKEIQGVYLDGLVVPDPSGDDLTRRGVFWGYNETPTKEELAKTREKMEDHYRTLITQAEVLYEDRATRAQIGKEHHLAADYFHLKSQWHVIAEAPQACPNCGEPIKSGLAYHMNAAGVTCVIDWKRTVEAGVKKLEDVPAAKRW